MRQIGKDTAHALAMRGTMKAKNTEVRDGAVFLHGHKIIWFDENGALWINLRGWNTSTTRSRINDVLRCLGYNARVSQRNYSLVVMLYGEIDHKYDSNDDILIG
jgi:hypothetical protein